MSDWLCKKCNGISTAEEWNKKTREALNDDYISEIDECPEFMYCPKCGGEIYCEDFEEI